MSKFGSLLFNIRILTLIFCIVHIDAGFTSMTPDPVLLAEQKSHLALKTKYLTLVYASIQCFPPEVPSEGADPGTLEDEAMLLEIWKTFDPASNLHLYKNPEGVQALLDFVESIKGEVPDGPFTNHDLHVKQMNLILDVLYPNSENFPLFFNTTVWLIQKVNHAMLYWTLNQVDSDAYAESAVSPSVTEIFPQLYLDKFKVTEIAGKTTTEIVDFHPVRYFMSDPGLNEFHTHWHIENPFWWNATKYEGIVRDRKGELFLFLHHQILARYAAELFSNGLPNVEPLILDPDYVCPESYYPDVININFKEFPPRLPGETLREFDNGRLIDELKLSYTKLVKGIEQLAFERPDGSLESLRYDNASDILGATLESSVDSVDREFYGVFHNFLHRLVGGMARKGQAIPGLAAHAETSIREPIFYRIHKLVDTIYLKLKTYSPAYTESDLDFPGVAISSLDIKINPADLSYYGQFHGQGVHALQVSSKILTTYFTQLSYDISTAARPCRGIGGKPEFIDVKTLTYVPFTYHILLRSSRSDVSQGMVRIFLLPVNDHEGKPLEIEEAHNLAIELDRFKVTIEGGKELFLQRSSLNSSLTRLAPLPGLKALYNLSKNATLAKSSRLSDFEVDTNQNQQTENEPLFIEPEMMRACGFPNNLLLPRGNSQGIPYKLMVMVSEEKEDLGDYLKFPLCGALEGKPYPDKRPMGFPFDRRGTRLFSDDYHNDKGQALYENVKQIKVLVKHRGGLQ